MKTIKIEGHKTKNIFDICKQAIINLDVEKFTADEDTGIIEYTTGVSFLSFGEEVKIEIQQIENQTHEINIKSSSLFPLQIIDWSTNSENIDIISSEISKQLKK